MNIYNVSIKGTIVVAANSNKEAKEKALHLVRIGKLSYELSVNTNGIITESVEIPDGWEESDWPFGTDDNKSIAEYLAECPTRK